jgi:hypothetical protein
MMRWIQGPCPARRPQKIKEGVAIKGVQCSEADIHACCMWHPTTNEHVDAKQFARARSAIKYNYTQQAMVVTEATKAEVEGVVQGQKRDL